MGRMAETYRGGVESGLVGKPSEKEQLRAELRLRNVGPFTTSAMAFGFAYLGWSVFDWLLAREQWSEFLAIRVCVAVLSVTLALLIRRPPMQRFVWPVFWIWLFACGAGVALMLPHVEGNLLPYVLGFSLILYGAGLLPFWPPVYAASNVLAILIASAAAFFVWPSSASSGDQLTGAFFVLTGALASVIMATFKYDLARRDHQSRAALAATTDRLSNALERLRQSDQLQRRFFANLTHELRTPLTLILSPVQALRGEGLTERHQATLASVEANADRLLRLIDDLLDLSRLDAGELRIRVAPVQIDDVLARVMDRMRPAAERSGLLLKLEVEGPCPSVMGDAHRLDMVVTNLLGNALKHCRDGGEVRVVVRALPDGVSVEVHDQGPGIAAVDLERIFARFQQAGTGAGGGVGIGLALARELVELHGGTLQARSVEGVGSTFWFQLPLGAEHLRPEVIERRGQVVDKRRLAGGGRRTTDQAGVAVDTRVPEPSGPPLLLPVERPVRLERGRRPRLLVVEDQPQLRAFLVELLGQEFEVVASPDGEHAWTSLSTVRPDLVLTDLSMPGRTGASLCRAIKADPAFHAIPVVLLTAWAGNETVVQAYADGADDFVAKPFHPEILRARLRAQLRLRELGAVVAHRERLAAVGAMSAGLLHEIRNPLNALMQASSTLREPDLPDELRSELLGVVGEAADRIHALTSTLDAHARPAERPGEGFADLGAGIAATLRLLDHKLQGLTVTWDPTASVVARASPAGLNQVFVNLLDNAVKAGARTIRIELGQTDDACVVRLVDDGRGIDPQLLPRIFDPFVTTATGGESSGLGLYLCREIIERDGGRIEAESRPGQGTVFTVRVPRAM